MSLEAMMINKGSSTRERDLIATMDDATSTVYSGLFVDEESTLSSQRGGRAIESRGMVCTFCRDEG
jgi:hypothetical protein